LEVLTLTKAGEQVKKLASERRGAWEKSIMYIYIREWPLMQKLKNNHDYDQFKQQRNKVNTLVKKAKILTNSGCLI